MAECSSNASLILNSPNKVESYKACIKIYKLIFSLACHKHTSLSLLFQSKTGTQRISRELWQKVVLNEVWGNKCAWVAEGILFVPLMVVEFCKGVVLQNVMMVLSKHAWASSVSCPLVTVLTITLCSHKETSYFFSPLRNQNNFLWESSTCHPGVLSHIYVWQKWANYCSESYCSLFPR